MLFARTFRSLRHRNYALYFAGQVVSFTGSWMQSAALMWIAYDITNDPFWPPLMLVAAVGPTLFLGPVGGALADRYKKKRLIFATQSCFLATSVALALMIAGNRAEPWLMFALQLVNGLVQSIDLPTRLAFVPDLIPRDDLINAVGLNSLSFNVARALGPAFAGLIFLLTNDVMTGAAACFTINALSYVTVLVALRWIKIKRDFRTEPLPVSRFLDGFRFLANRPGLTGLIILTGSLSVFGWPLLTLLPAYTESVLHQREKAYSFLVSAFGAGALVGSLMTASFGTPARREKFLLIGGLGCLAGMTIVYYSTTLSLAFIAAGVFGFGLILYLSTGQSIMQLDSPDAGRGKIMALWAMMLSGSAIPGHLLAGWAAQHYSLSSVFFVMWIGVAASVLGIGLLVMSRKLRPGN